MANQTLLVDWVDIPQYRMSFKFKFVQQSSGIINIYILEQPSYRSRQSTSGHSTHRYGLPDNPYICYEPNPRNLNDAKVVASEWARRTAYYIRNGKWFNKGDLS